MKRTPHDIGARLDRLLARHRKPSPDRMQAAIDRVGRQVGSSAEIRTVSVASASRRKPRRWAYASVAAMVTLAAAIGTAMLWPQQETALYRVLDGKVHRGDPPSLMRRFGGTGMIRSNGGGGAVLALADGSRIEMRSHTELSLDRANDGMVIRLSSGGIIVNAAKQRTGHLYVQTRDMTVSVVGTVFLVNADTQGSRVAVIEGEVRVQQGNTEQTLRPGDQVATNPQEPSPPVIDEIAWSRFKQQLTLKLDLLVEQFGQAAVPPDVSPFRPADTPKWEVSSVRLCGPGIVPGARGGGASGAVAAGGVRIDPSYLRVTCMRLRFLIEDAYVKYLERDAFRRRWIFPVDGGPDWLDTDLYSIEAKPVNPPVDRQTMGGPMLQALLEERFKLKLRREVRQEPVYELRVAESGFKLQPLKEGECEARKRRISNEPAVAGNLGLVFPAMTYTDADGRQVGTCGLTLSGSPGARTVRLYGLPLYELTNYLSLDRIVLDKTGIQGLFDISVTYGTDVSPMGNRDNCSSWRSAEAECRRQVAETWERLGITPAPPPSGPSGADTVFDALRKQLGLELVPTIGPRTHYFVEHVERPTPN
ncbi:MAG: TIGR03435 family protein [Vicinamibacterales bacterium]